MKKILACSLFLIMLSFTGFAAPGDPPPDPPDPSDVPIDGGLSWLIASGVGYGVYQYKKKKNKQ